MTVDFVAIDFETANSFRGSPCAVGLARVRDGVVVETASSLMRPPSGYDHFDPWNIRIHGITPDQVKDAPVFADLWPSVLDFVGEDTVVAHNASFDLGVIREACTASGLPWPTMRYACTLLLARKTYHLLSYSLPFVVEAAGLSLEDHHDAGQMRWRPPTSWWTWQRAVGPKRSTGCSPTMGYSSGCSNQRCGQGAYAVAALDSGRSKSIPTLTPIIRCTGRLSFSQGRCRR